MTRTKSPPFPEAAFCRMSFETFRLGCVSVSVWACVRGSKTKRVERSSETKLHHSIGKIKRFICYSGKLVSSFTLGSKVDSVNGGGNTGANPLKFGAIRRDRSSLTGFNVQEC